MNYRFIIADVFAEKPFGGNQLAVFPDARGLSDRAMQALAREFNFAETSFVFPNDRPGQAIRVRIFTPRAEVMFAGHPTVGTAVVLAHEGAIPAVGTVVFEEGIGPVQVDVQMGDRMGTSVLTLDRAVESAPEPPLTEAVAASLSLNPNQVRTSWFASVGLPFCIAHLDSREAVDCAALDRRAWQETLAAAWSPNLFFFSGLLLPSSALYARMFAPALGIEEDPATGSAAAALAAILANERAEHDGTFTWNIAQGVALGRASLMQVSARKQRGVTDRVRVGGSTVIVGDGKMRVPVGF